MSGSQKDATFNRFVKRMDERIVDLKRPSNLMMIILRGMENFIMLDHGQQWHKSNMMLK